MRSAHTGESSYRSKTRLNSDEHLFRNIEELMKRERSWRSKTDTVWLILQKFNKPFTSSDFTLPDST